MIINPQRLASITNMVRDTIEQEDEGEEGDTNLCITIIISALFGFLYFASLIMNIKMLSNLEKIVAKEKDDED